MITYDYMVYIGRFQPFHLAHYDIIRKALSISKKVLVLIGSSESPKTIENPFTYAERKSMIEDSFYGFKEQLIYSPLKDYPDDSRWVEVVGGIISDVVGDSKKVGVIGHDKDHTSFYLNYFPQYEFLEVPAFPPYGETIDATKVRKLMFEGDFGFISGSVPNGVFDYIVKSQESDWFKLLVQEYDFVKAYKKSWANTPHPAQFVTCDAVVVQSGHVLLVKRGGFPGYGQWATPGGFIGEFETIENAVVRELKEETKLKIPEKILSRMVKNAPNQVFSDPKRSTRGRTFTHVYLFQLDDSEKLPKVKGSDDAIEARWFSFAEFEKMESVMYEDHHAIVSKMLTMLK